MQRVSLICVGTLKERYFAGAAAEYQKRMKGLCDFKVHEIQPVALDEKHAGKAEVQKALAKEGAQILKRVPSSSQLVALCVEGKPMSSEGLAKLLQQAALSHSGGLCFVIGSSHGLASEVVQKAEVRLSLSQMTFPHQMARVLLTEQIYRGFMINSGRSYHK